MSKSEFSESELSLNICGLLEDSDLKDPEITNLVKAMASGEAINSILSDGAILEAIKDSRIKIFPFDENQLNNCSYDVRLGKWYYRQNDGKKINKIKEATEKHGRSYVNSGKFVVPRYEEGPAITPGTIHEMWFGPYEMTVNTDEKSDLPWECRYVVLKPGETILANTFEFIGGCHNITTSMRAKSTTARMCVSVCGDAGWGDIGYTNRWCMQIRNNGVRDVILVWGMKIAQIIFHKSDVPQKDYSKDGQYQTIDDFKEIMAEWTPESMLPIKKFTVPDEFLIGMVEKSDSSDSEDTSVAEVEH